MSANSTVTAAKWSAIMLSPALSRSAMGAGRMFSSRVSERRRAASSSRVRSATRSSSSLFRRRDVAEVLLDVEARLGSRRCRAAPSRRPGRDAASRSRRSGRAARTDRRPAVVLGSVDDRVDQGRRAVVSPASGRRSPGSGRRSPSPVRRTCPRLAATPAEQVLAHQRGVDDARARRRTRRRRSSFPISRATVNARSGAPSWSRQ